MKVENGHFDSEIIQNLKIGDDNAMIMLYKLHWKSLYVSAYNILKDKEASEDIVQELFIKIWNKRAQLNITGSIHHYLLAATRYEVYRKIRESKRYEPIVDEMINQINSTADCNSLEYKELEVKVSSIIETLSPKCKAVYILSRNEQLSHKEIAGKLDISTKTVRNHLTRALHQLRISLHQLILFLFIIICR